MSKADCLRRQQWTFGCVVDPQRRRFALRCSPQRRKPRLGSGGAAGFSPIRSSSMPDRNRGSRAPARSGGPIAQSPRRPGSDHCRGSSRRPVVETGSATAPASALRQLLVETSPIETKPIETAGRDQASAGCVSQPSRSAAAGRNRWPQEKGKRAKRESSRTAGHVTCRRSLSRSAAPSRQWSQTSQLPAPLQVQTAAVAAPPRAGRQPERRCCQTRAGAGRQHRQTVLPAALATPSEPVRSRRLPPKSGPGYRSPRCQSYRQPLHLWSSCPQPSTPLSSCAPPSQFRN